MRRLLLISVAAVLATTAACGGEGDSASPPRTSPTGASSPSSGPSSSPSGATRAAVCSEVRAGIDAFNTGALEETVSHFRTAVPLARRAAEKDPSQDSTLLLRAVRYYAALPAEDYPAASATSPAFQRWKAVTLGLCASGGDQLSPLPSPSPTESGLQA